MQDFAATCLGWVLYAMLHTLRLAYLMIAWPLTIPFGRYPAPHLETDAEGNEEERYTKEYWLPKICGVRILPIHLILFAATLVPIVVTSSRAYHLNENIVILIKTDPLLWGVIAVMEVSGLAFLVVYSTLLLPLWLLLLGAFAKYSSSKTAEIVREWLKAKKERVCLKIELVD